MDEEGLLRLRTGNGGCFMMIGSAEGSCVPWSFSFTSFIAMENSNLSIFPSLFISAKDLADRYNTESEKTVYIYPDKDFSEYSEGFRHSKNVNV